MLRRCAEFSFVQRRLAVLVLLVLHSVASFTLRRHVTLRPMVWDAKANHDDASAGRPVTQKDWDDPEVSPAVWTRRSIFRHIIGTTTAFVSTVYPSDSQAAITQDSNWPLWPALPVAPYSRRKTIRYSVGPDIWAFDQLIGIYYVHVPIRMTVVALQYPSDNDDEPKKKKKNGLLVYAPVAPTRECLSLLQELIEDYGPVKHILLPTVAVEHKVNAGPFARAFPHANFYVTDQQYAFPLNLPNSFLGLPRWTQTLPRSSNNNNLWNGEFEHEVLTVQPGVGSRFQDVALFHKPSRTLLLCDALFATNGEPPRILTQEEDYTRALLFHARETKDDVVLDTPDNRRKGWRRIVLLFNFFFPGSGTADLGFGPILEAFQTPFYHDGWGGWKPFSFGTDDVKDFQTFSADGKATMYPIVQIILSRGPQEVQRWLNVVMKWDFQHVIPAHLDAPLEMNPDDFEKVFDFVRTGRNEVRFCDEDVAFLRKAEEGPLNFSVYKTPLGLLRGQPCGLNPDAGQLTPQKQG